MGAYLQIIGEIQTREYAARDGAKKSVSEIREHRIARLDRAPKADLQVTILPSETGGRLALG